MGDEIEEARRGQCQAAGCARTARLTQRSAASINVELTGGWGKRADPWKN
jgi:hypothetical protein